MKKNIAMRVAAFLFILTMISTCAFATTFAKYTTSNYATDEARVAKWGVTVSGITEATNNELFVKEYDDSANATVRATVDVVAPGTEGKLAYFSIKGTPEVATKVIYSAKLELEKWGVTGDDFYCPIIITVGTDSFCGLDYADAAAFATDVENAIARTIPFAVGTKLEDQTTSTNLDISWSWAISGTTGSTGDQSDVFDTELGDKAAENESNAATISLKVTCTVEQVD